MGEVRAKVKLTNAVDEELVRRGLLSGLLSTLMDGKNLWE